VQQPGAGRRERVGSFRVRVVRLPEELVRAIVVVIDRYGDDPAPVLREQVAIALVNQGVALGMLGRPADALAAYQQVITDYRDDLAPALREAVAKALLGTRVALGMLGRPRTRWPPTSR